MKTEGRTDPGSTPRETVSEPRLVRFIERLPGWGRGLLEWADPYLWGFGWTFGMLFTVLALSPIPHDGRAITDLLALGIALLALSRAAAAGMYGRRHRCRCGETAVAPTPRAEAPVTSRPEP